MPAIDRVIDEHGGWRWNLQLREGLRKPIRSPPQQMLLELCSVLGLTLRERETSQDENLVIESMVTAGNDARKRRNWQGRTGFALNWTG